MLGNALFLLFDGALTLLAAYLYFFPKIEAINPWETEVSEENNETEPYTSPLMRPTTMDKLFALCNCPSRLLAVTIALYLSLCTAHFVAQDSFPDYMLIHASALGVFVPLYIASLHDVEEMYVYDIVVLSALPSAICIGLKLMGYKALLFGLLIGFAFFILSYMTPALGEGDIMPAGILAMIIDPHYIHVFFTLTGLTGCIFAVLTKTRVVPLVPFLSLGGFAAFFMTVLQYNT
jgi:hypothetical protein